MAAGLGLRYRGFKQLDRVGPGGEMLLEYAIFDARRAGFRRVVFIIRRELTEAFAELARHLPSDVEVSSVCQDPERLPAWFTPPRRTKPWGTVHAVLAARDAISTPFAAVNADDFYGTAAFGLAIRACGEASTAETCSVIGLPLDATLSEHGSVVRGICRTNDGWLQELDEVYGIQRTSAGISGATSAGPRSLTGRELASMNFWVFAPGVFGLLAERFDAFLRRRGDDPNAELPLPEAINELLQAGSARVRAIEAPGPWFGLTHPDDRPKVVAGIRGLHDCGAYPDPLWASLKLTADS
jgi:choline kinase